LNILALGVGYCCVPIRRIEGKDHGFRDSTEAQETPQGSDEETKGPQDQSAGEKVAA
jgi:hypothetical protein